MQNKISTPIAAAAIAGVLVVALVIFLVVRGGHPTGTVSSGPTVQTSPAYQHPGPGAHP